MDHERTKALLAADRTCSDEERERFLGHFPRLRGAHVADVLDILNDADYRLDVLEPLAEAHDEWAREHAYATYLLLYTRDTTPTWDEVHGRALAIQAEERNQDHHYGEDRR